MWKNVVIQAKSRTKAQTIRHGMQAKLRNAVCRTSWVAMEPLQVNPVGTGVGGLKDMSRIKF